MWVQKAFETQKVGQIGWRKAGESRGFPIIWMGIIRRCLADEKKEMQKPGKIKKCVGKNPCQSKEGTLAWDRRLCLSQWQWTRRDLRQLQVIQQGKRKTNGTFQGMWLSRAQKGSFWLCNARPWAGKQKSGISGSWQRLKPTPWQRNR